MRALQPREIEKRKGSITEKRHSGAAKRAGMTLNVGNGKGVLDGFLEFLGRAEGNLLAGFDVDRFAGGGVAAHAGGALADLEDAEADDADALALLQVFCDLADHVGQNRLGGLLRQFVILGDRRCQMLECHRSWSRCFLRHIWPSSLVNGLSLRFASIAGRRAVRAAKTASVRDLKLRIPT